MASWTAVGVVPDRGAPMSLLRKRVQQWFSDTPRSLSHKHSHKRTASCLRNVKPCVSLTHVAMPCTAMTSCALTWF